MVVTDRKGASQLCRKVEEHRRSPSQCKHAGLSGATLRQAEAPPSVTCVELCIICEQDQPLVTNVSGPLPTSSQPLQEEGGTQAGTLCFPGLLHCPHHHVHVQTPATWRFQRS